MANYNIIKVLCDKKGITLKELSDKVVISETGLHQIFKSGSTKVITLEKIAKALGVPITTFFDDDPNDRIDFNSDDISKLFDKLNRAQFGGFTDQLYVYLIKENDDKYYITKTGVLNLMFDFIEDEKKWNNYGLLIEKLLEERKNLKK